MMTPSAGPSILDRLRRDLDIVTPDQLKKLSLLVHSDYGAGKTHFLGDALLTESQKGPVALINIRGEDGDLTLAGMGLGTVAYTVSSSKELTELLTALRRENLRAIGLDSLKLLAAMCMEEITGGGMPDKSHYMPLHWRMPRLVTLVKTTADIMVATCPSDKSVEQLSGRTRITPDMPGRQVTEVAGWFDFVGYLSADIMGRGKVHRNLMFTPNGNVITRQRRLRSIPDIAIPDGGGGWSLFMREVEASMVATLRKE